VVDRVMLARPEDLMRMLPDDLPERFTTADLATGLGRPPHIARQAAYCLRRLGLIEAIGKRGRAIEYRIASATPIGTGPSPTA
jgi:hypothetical protein